MQLFTQVPLATRRVTTSSLRQHGLPAVVSEPSRKRRECIVDVVLDALGVCPRVVGIQVLMDVHDEVVDGAVGVLDGR